MHDERVTLTIKMMEDLRINTTAKREVIKTDGATRQKPNDKMTSVGEGSMQNEI